MILRFVKENEKKKHFLALYEYHMLACATLFEKKKALPTEAKPDDAFHYS